MTQKNAKLKQLTCEVTVIAYKKNCIRMHIIRVIELMMFYSILYNISRDFLILFFFQMIKMLMVHTPYIVNKLLQNYLLFRT